MRRIDNGVARDGHENIITNEGLVYWKTELPDGSMKSYWREGEYYAFTLPEIDAMERDAKIIFEMLIAAGDHIVDHPDLMVRMGIPRYAHEQVKQSWNRSRGGEDFGSVYGRYDVLYGGNEQLDPTKDQPVEYDSDLGRIRLYEFNADTPTCFVESAVSQWSYHEQTGQGEDQWNNIYEDLVDAWKRNLGHIEALLGHKPVVHFLCTAQDDSGEDEMNLKWIMKACEDAGYTTKIMYIEQIYLGEDGRFYDDEGGDHLDVAFKLYPWEMMVHDDREWGEAAFQDMERIGERSADDSTYTGGTVWIEPPYKMLWSNKAILAVLWQLFGNDPEKSQLLIPAYFIDEKPDWMTDYVVKPIFGREGASMRIYESGKKDPILETEGQYGNEGFIVQQYAPPPNFPGLTGRGDGEPEDNHPVLGIWMIDGEPSGLGIRESEGVVTDNYSCFAPHVIAAA